MAIISSGLGHQDGWQASMPDINQSWGKGDCCFDPDVNPRLLLQLIKAGPHKDVEIAGRRVTLPRRYLNQRHQSEVVASQSGHENAFLQFLSSGQLSKNE